MPDKQAQQDRRKMGHLILQAQVGQRLAWEQLLEATQLWLRPYLRHLIQDSALAEDIIQETLLIIYRKLRWLDEPRAYRLWVYRIASREAFRAIKARQRQTMSELQPDYPAAEYESPSPELVDELMEKISDLSSNTRAVLLLHYVEGQSLKAISGILEIPIGTAKSRLAHGLSTVRKRSKKDQT